MIAQPSDNTTKYQVRLAPGGWRVDRADDCLGVFADSAQAVDEACRSARADAGHGRVAIVTTETVPQEFHCYVPPPGVDPPAASPALPPYLRLLVSR